MASVQTIRKSMPVIIKKKVLQFEGFHSKDENWAWLLQRNTAHTSNSRTLNRKAFSIPSLYTLNIWRRPTVSWFNIYIYSICNIIYFLIIITSESLWIWILFFFLLVSQIKMLERFYLSSPHICKFIWNDEEK